MNCGGVMDLQDVVRLRKAGVQCSEIAERCKNEWTLPKADEPVREREFDMEEFLAPVLGMLLLTSPVWGIYLLVVFVKWCWVHS
jgi:hypothetical protein